MKCSGFTCDDAQVWNKWGQKSQRPLSKPRFIRNMAAKNGDWVCYWLYYTTHDYYTTSV